MELKESVYSVVVVFFVVRIDRKYNGALYVSLIGKNKDEDFKNGYRICNYDCDWSAYVTELLLLICRHCLLTLTQRRIGQ